MKEKVVAQLKKIILHSFIEIVLRGNSAINSALSLVPKDKIILIPEEGGWLHYRIGPKKLGLKFLEVKCHDAKINLEDLEEKLSNYNCGAFLYQNPGGYFAEQSVEEIYQLCQKHDCLVILDASGALGSKLPLTADILLGSFGGEKPVNAGFGGFISAKDKKILEQLKLEVLSDEKKLEVILNKLEELPERIQFLTDKRKKIIKDLSSFDIVHKKDFGLVVVVKFSTSSEKEKIIEYCKREKLEWTECPRYLRLNQPAISIEIKRL